MLCLKRLIQCTDFKSGDAVGCCMGVTQIDSLSITPEWGLILCCAGQRNFSHSDGHPANTLNNVALPLPSLVILLKLSLSSLFAQFY